jgi:type III pantothenate kinase
MNLVVDIGNTKIKAAIFNVDQIIEFVSFEESDAEKELSNLINRHKVHACILSSVKVNNEQILNLLTELPYYIELDSTTKIPFKNLYGTPTTLGKDRIALVAAASNQYVDKNVLVIDAGTCITYDFLNAKNEYLGGAISPGINIRYRSLHDYTSKLPKLSKSDDYFLIGSSTAESIHSGVINGIVQEIHGVINQYKEKYPDLTVILTGGDTKFLFKQLKNSIFAHQNFLLLGLNQILTFNNKE